jgi:hypothetical protein
MPRNELETDRQARLAAALRENLKRRKEQGRARRSAVTATGEAGSPRGEHDDKDRPRPEKD